MKGLRILFLCLSSLIVCLLNASYASAVENRVALVIGNSGYSQVPQLVNPRKDSEAIAATFRKVGFKTVTLRHDLGRDAMNSALHAFAREAEKADWAVVYFAGHGIEYAGVNYIIPSDATLSSDRDVQFEAIALNQVLAAVEGARKLRLVILDACRDNPFLGRMKRSVASRSITRGLVRVEPSGGVLVAFAAKEGEIALDGDENNSPFTTALVKHIHTPGLEINRLFRRVRSEVLLSTNQRQEPYVYGSLPDEDFYFKPSLPQNSVVKLTAPEPADRLNGPEPLPHTAPDRVEAEHRDPNARVATQSASPAVAPSPDQTPVAMSPSASASLDKPFDSISENASEGVGARASNLLSPPKAPVKSLDNPDHAQVADVSVGLESETPSQVRNPGSVSLELARSIQSELRRLGCETASTDGTWSGKNRTALKNFGKYAGRSIEPEDLDDKILVDMKNRRSRVCPLICKRGYLNRDDTCIPQSCPGDQIRDAGGLCIAAKRVQPQRKTAHAREPAELNLPRKPVDVPPARTATPSRGASPRASQQRIVAPPQDKKAVTRVVRSSPMRAAPSRHCQMFNGQSICD